MIKFITRQFFRLNSHDIIEQARAAEDSLSRLRAATEMLDEEQEMRAELAEAYVNRIMSFDRGSEVSHGC